MTEQTYKKQDRNLFEPQRTMMYALVVIVVLVIGCLGSTFSVASDFAQDYLAASAIRDGRSANAPLVQLARIYGVPESAVTSFQNAHPPLAILWAAPFTYFSWDTARFLWSIQLMVLAGIFLMIRPVRLIDFILLSPAWIFGLAVGNVDMVVIGLVLTAVSSFPSIGVSILLGLAAALKVYPLFLIAGLLAMRRYFLFFTALIFGALPTLLGMVYIGFGNFIGWLLYLPHNINLYSLSAFNLSLAKVTTLLKIGHVPLIILGALMIYVQRRQKKINPLLPGMLLVSPLAWLHQILFLSHRLNFGELMGCSICCLFIYAFGLSDLPQKSFVCSLCSVLLTLIILEVYIRLFYEGRTKQP